MTEIKWIKIAIDIFDDEKVQLIEELPEGDAILLIWFKLLILAGKKNACGLIYLTEKIPYSEEMLTKIFRKKINLVRLSLKTFETFEMIEIKNNIIKVLNWEKYQNEEALEKLKKSSRERQRRYREKQNLLEDNVTITKSNDKNNVTDNVTDNVTKHNSNALELELDLEKEKDLKKENIKRKKKNINNEIKEIIDYLNQKCNKNFTYKNKSFNSHINARISEGFIIENFKKVIDNKIKDKNFQDNPGWYNPDTLFSPSHFEKYLNEYHKKTDAEIQAEREAEDQRLEANLMAAFKKEKEDNSIF